ncbi:hypothetical protein F5876DRAFT_65373 [Lentinula aff. lateritia]|uniref:Uncharacterized protein n=1 Tax=Lentinula aff. lateritia TaxID=2804960 RepID=A0ACC1U163_9AGAR|nr:hypothetical protein F5876DRAFT_65373 [Lentinula aff. lateritia]
MYIFRQRFTPGKLYITATLLFFIAATVSVMLDLISVCTRLPLPFLMFRGSVYIEPSGDGTLAFVASAEALFLFVGSLSDIMLLQRCYRLWNSRKYVIVVPAFLIPACVVLWIVTAVIGLEGISYMAYILVTLAQNLYLSGMIAGRMYWLNRNMKTIFAGKSSQTPSKPIIIILESAIITPIFLTVWVSLEFSGSGTSVISPCALTQIVGIASTLMVVRIGLGIDVLSTSQTCTTQIEVENQGSGEHHLECNNIGTTGQLLQPFQLGYVSGDQLEYVLDHSEQSTTNLPSTSNQSFQPFTLKYHQPSPHNTSGVGKKKKKEIISP